MIEERRWLRWILLIEERRWVPLKIKQCCTRETDICILSFKDFIVAKFKLYGSDELI